MKVGLLTLPPLTNYGGILQAFALQRVLQKLGHDTYLINRRNSAISRNSYLKMRLKSYYMSLKGIKTNWVFSEKARKERERLLSFNTQLFIDKYIQPQTKSFNTPTGFQDIPRFDAYIVGSDQVWRPQYTSNIYDYFFDFLGESKSLRIAYAASFGLDEWTFTEEMTAKCRSLISKFKSVSVRESDAIDLCNKYLGVEAYHVLDPTMLLTVDEYLSLIDLSRTENSGGELMSYILDNNSEKEKLVNEIADDQDLKVFNLALLNLDQKGNIIPIPPVENWLRGFIDAKFIVTDSFHGTVFSILFNKPFIAIANSSRGISRFISLLRIFDLENRLVLDVNNVDKLLGINDINWDKVNSILNIKRTESLSFLSQSLS